MTSRTLEIGPEVLPSAIRDYLLDAIDLASDQDQRTWLTSGGKRIAMIVTAEDGERLAALDYPAPDTCEQCGSRLVAGEGDDNLCGPCTELTADELDAQLAGPPDTLRELREQS